MTTRERFHAVMDFQPFDRLPLLEWAGWWDKTIERGRGEGLPAAADDRYAICRHFGLDVYKQDWFPVCRPGCPSPVSHCAGIIADEADYDRIRPHLFPAAPSPGEMGVLGAEHPAATCLGGSPSMGSLVRRRLLGIGGTLRLYDQPPAEPDQRRPREWILVSSTRSAPFCTPDFMTFRRGYELQHGRCFARVFDSSSPLLRPHHPRPRQRVILRSSTRRRHHAPAHGSRTRSGRHCRWSGDIAALAGTPAVRFIEHFDKMTMNAGRRRMRAEFERLAPTAAQGGFLVSCDHQTPPGVSLDAYQTYLALFREVAAEIGRLSQQVIGCA